MTIAYVTTPFTTGPKFNKAKFKPHDRQRLRLMKVTTSTNLNAIAAANQAVNVAYIPSECIVLAVKCRFRLHQTMLMAWYP